MLQQLTTMLEMQERMNRRVHPDWIAQDFAWYRALWIECGELIDHHGYKWWKKQQPDWDHIRLEVVDIWHFGMSMRFDGTNTPATIAAGILAELAEEPPARLPLLEAVEALATMNARQITALLVCEGAKPVGIVHIHDLLREGVA